MPLPPTLSRLAAAGLATVGFSVLALAVPPATVPPTAMLLSAARAAASYEAPPCGVLGGPPSVDQVLVAAAVEFRGVPGADLDIITARLGSLNVGALPAPIGGRLWATMRGQLVERDGSGPHLTDEVAGPLLCRIWRAAPGVSL